MKRKQARRCMADGGVIRETPEQMLARMNAKYGLGDAGKSPAPQPSTDQTQRPAASPQPPAQGGLMGKTTDAIGRRNEELKKAANYARGGIMPVVGAGTGTSDSVPVVVAGQDVRLSNGEGAAILPARTMSNPAAVQAVEGIIEATNGKPPVRGARGLAYGGILGQQNQTGISGVWRTGNSFTQTDSGPSIVTPSVAAMPYPAAAQPVSAQPVPTQATTTNIVRNGNSFSAAPPSLSSQALTSPAGQPAPAAGPLVGQAPPVQPTVQQPSPAPAPPTTDAYGNSLAQTQRYQKQLDELQKGPENQVMKLAAGGVIDPEEEKRRKAQAPTAQEVYGPAYRGIAGALSGGTATTPTSAPTAQEVYRGVSAKGLVDAVTPKNNLASHPIYSGVSAQGMIDAVMPGSGQAPAPGAQSAPQPPVVAPATNALRRPVAISAPSQQTQTAPPEVMSLWAGMDTRDERTGLEQERARVAAGRGLADEIRAFNGPSLMTSALVGDGRKPDPARGAQQSTARKIDNSVAAQVPSTTQSDARKIDLAMPAHVPALGPKTTGNARFNPESGTLSFTQPGFDPTKQSFAPGTGAISNTAGKTILLAPSGIAGAVQQPHGAVDAYGNSTARTDQMKAELAQLQANGSQADGPRVSMLQSLPLEQAGRDRFAQFVRQSDADRLAQDLATGGGNARTNAGKIAALHAMRGGIADELGRNAQRDVAGIQGAHQAVIENLRGQNQLANTRLAGQNQFATTGLAGENALAVENLRQSGPEKALSALKLRGEVEDASAKRSATNALQSAIDSGDPSKISTAWKKGIAAGVVKPEQGQVDSYKPITDPMTGEVKGAFNTRTGQAIGSSPITSKDEVARALATGKITKEEVAKRIVAAGGNPKDYGL
ncbi:hypothetical protein [Candidatus Accumulibacter vicinus]|uniref:Uncharacterized protein n=1 Tax=Candidatus Accumulibacter vicinus TaxID=2954382 RepID=A0A084Y2H7_9PROT|nr:hypothetical protein [Candidatus Accumulibacter vicinus]KFB68921.1 MAG: hypothetical protein CAPSK01_001776 [Candidatus Accumulibacter vicinus]